MPPQTALALALPCPRSLQGILCWHARLWTKQVPQRQRNHPSRGQQPLLSAPSAQPAVAAAPPRSFVVPQPFVSTINPQLRLSPGPILKGPAGSRQPPRKQNPQAKAGRKRGLSETDPGRNNDEAQTKAGRTVTQVCKQLPRNRLYAGEVIELLRDPANALHARASWASLGTDKASHAGQPGELQCKVAHGDDADAPSTRISSSRKQLQASQRLQNARMGQSEAKPADEPVATGQWPCMSGELTSTHQHAHPQQQQAQPGMSPVLAGKPRHAPCMSVLRHAQSRLDEELVPEHPGARRGSDTQPACRHHIGGDHPLHWQEQPPQDQHANVCPDVPAHCKPTQQAEPHKAASPTDMDKMQTSQLLDTGTQQLLHLQAVVQGLMPFKAKHPPACVPSQPGCPPEEQHAQQPRIGLDPEMQSQPSCMPDGPKAEGPQDGLDALLPRLQDDPESHDAQQAEELGAGLKALQSCRPQDCSENHDAQPAEELRAGLDAMLHLRPCGESQRQHAQRPADPQAGFNARQHSRLQDDLVSCNAQQTGSDVKFSWQQRPHHKMGAQPAYATPGEEPPACPVLPRSQQRKPTCPDTDKEQLQRCRNAKAAAASKANAGQSSAVKAVCALSLSTSMPGPCADNLAATLQQPESRGLCWRT